MKPFKCILILLPFWLFLILIDFLSIPLLFPLTDRHARIGRQRHHERVLRLLLFVPFFALFRPFVRRLFRLSQRRTRRPQHLFLRLLRPVRRILLSPQSIGQRSRRPHTNSQEIHLARLVYRGRRNIKCEPPKTVAPPLTDQTTPINDLCWVLNHSLGLYKWRHQGDFEISTPV